MAKYLQHMNLGEEYGIYLNIQELCDRLSFLWFFPKTNRGRENKENVIIYI